jgi:hypothetical protein
MNSFSWLVGKVGERPKKKLPSCCGEGAEDAAKRAGAGRLPARKFSQAGESRVLAMRSTKPALAEETATAELGGAAVAKPELFHS